MARLRKFVCYRDWNRPFTRFSKYKKHSYIKSRPANRIARYTTGKDDDFQYKLHLVSKQKVQIRDNALESARQTTIRALSSLGKVGFFFQMRVFPHHILRENPLASGAGADRLSTGMAHSYGKPIGNAAQVRMNQEVFTIFTTKERIPLVRAALKRGAHKLPCKCTVTLVEPKKPSKKPVVKAAPKKATEPKKTAEPAAAA